MIKENQRLLNRLNVLTDATICFAMLPLAFWIRFSVFRDGNVAVPLSEYLPVDTVFTLIQIFTYAAFGLYQSQRRETLRRELGKLLTAELLDAVLLLSWLFLVHGEHYSRWTFAIYFLLIAGFLCLKRTVLYVLLRRFRDQGFNQKHVLIVGSGHAAARYLAEIRRSRELGYQAIGYVSARSMEGWDLPYLGNFEALPRVLERRVPDEVILALDIEDYRKTAQLVAACEKSGSKLSIIPFYADYISAHPHFDELNGIPLLNVRHIPLDNWGNAFLKRTVDIAGSALLLLLTSPLLLLCAIGVRLSSPGPVIFRQERVGRNKKTFPMYKFRSMRVNTRQDSAWSTRRDDRRTAFGSFIRKCSLDELPQLWNVLRGDMSLVGPRPELPKFVDQFREEIPLYMIRHQVRPGITGWAQINGLRGDTPIRERVEHDIYYIEHWDPLLDLRILLATVFKGKFVNDEEL